MARRDHSLDTLLAEHDHKHRLLTVRPYQYRDAVSLVADFWSEVEAVLREKGVWS